jgi:drug/metabolite transporter (DMT)-like permease
MNQWRVVWIFTTLSWWSSTVVCTVTSKSVLGDSTDVWLVSCSQLLCSAVMGLIVSQGRYGTSCINTSTSIESIDAEPLHKQHATSSCGQRKSLLRFSTLLYICGVSHAVAAVTTNYSFCQTSAVLTHVVKASEPLCTLLLKFFISGEKPTVSSASSIGVVFVGVILLTSGHTGRRYGILCAIVSNFALSVRSVCTDILTKQRPHLTSDIFFHSNKNATIISFCSFAFFTYRYGGFPIDYPSYELILLPTTSFFIYNYCGTILLAKCPLELYALLNVCRRVFIIVITSLIYKLDGFRGKSILGIACVTLGLFTYEYGRVNRTTAKS